MTNTERASVQRPSVPGLFFSLFLATWFLPIPLTFAGIDLAKWKYSRAIEVPSSTKAGLVTIPIESDIWLKCRPDLGDLRVLDSRGNEVPIIISIPGEYDRPEGFSARVFRITDRPGKWTDIWIDKTGKVVSGGLEIQTNSTDFLRRVEIRGSDNARDEYVVRVDGLIAVLNDPGPLCSLEIKHPLNNFQYLRVRILDDGRPPLRVTGVVCHTDEQDRKPSPLVPLRIIDNRRTGEGRHRTVIVDLGGKRFPVRTVEIETLSPQFVAPVTISGAYKLGQNSWEQAGRGTFFRLRKGPASKEGLIARFHPKPYRYLKLDIAGSSDGHPVIDEVSGRVAMSWVKFHLDPGVRYRLLYHNPQAPTMARTSRIVRRGRGDIALASSPIGLGPERRIPKPQPVPKAAKIPPKKQSFGFGMALGIALLMVGLILLFSLTLRSRSRNRGRMRGPVIR